MKKNIKSFLLPFYFGSVNEDERLKVERELLIDTSLLTEFLDLKREIESAEAIPSGPSYSVWYSIKSKLIAKKKVIIPAFGVAVFASIIAILIFVDLNSTVPNKHEPAKGRTELIFDSSSELPASSNVL